jgi:hypothetical protein
MDFKILILLLIIILILIYLVREVLTIKNILKNNDSYQDNKLKNKLSLITQEIKDYNNDLLVQAKKINKINSQKITNISNYYTEDESSGNKNLLEYLSDVKNTVSNQNFKINYNECVKELDNISDISSTSINSTLTSANTTSHINIYKTQALVDICNNIVDNSNNILNDMNNLNNDDNISIENDNDDIIINNSIKNNSLENIDNTNIPDNNNDNNNDNNKDNDIENHNNRDNNQENNNQENNDEENKKELKSIDTGNFMITTLGPLNNYTKQQLDKIAKMYTIPITYMDGSLRKTYKKEELYLKINEVLNKKSNQ